MAKIKQTLEERINRGGLPLAYDLYNKADLNETMCTLNCKSWNYGRQGAPVVFEIYEEEKEQERGD